MAISEDDWGGGSCAVCGATCRVGLLMCGPHWARVPRALRSAVFGALARWNRGRCSLDVLRAAQRAAVEAAG